jgi:N-acetylmuramoyl-L-alanine amidase
MNIVISSAHGLKIRGAEGYIDEVDEARKVVDEVAKILKRLGVDVSTFHDNTSKDQQTNLETIVEYHNDQGKHDLDVSIHFNAYEETDKAMGVEVLYVTEDELAKEVSAAIADVAELPDRGAKYRDDLYFLNNTKAPAILIECLFVDSKTDTEHYREYFTDICRAIAYAISGDGGADDELEDAA